MIIRLETKTGTESGIIPFIVLLVAFDITGIVLMAVLSRFGLNELALSQEITHWGALGDFLGGSLSAVFAFLGLIALLYTIRLQLTELRYTREEMAESRLALQDQATALEEQRILMQSDSMDRAFFSLLTNLRQVTEAINTPHSAKTGYFALDLWAFRLKNGTGGKSLLEYLEEEKWPPSVLSLHSFLYMVGAILTFIDRQPSSHVSYYRSLLAATLTDSSFTVLKFYSAFALEKLPINRRVALQSLSKFLDEYHDDASSNDASL